MRPTGKVALALLLAAVASLSSGITAWALRHDAGGEAVYVVGAVTVTHPHRLPAYRAISEPLAHRVAGYEPLAFHQPIMLEGEAPVNGRFFVERYDSMEQLQTFLTELKASGALELRDAAADVHFLLALPAYRGE
jgi:uncharacterized protein (DUF1330 family)